MRSVSARGGLLHLLQERPQVLARIGSLRVDSEGFEVVLLRAVDVLPAGFTNWLYNPTNSLAFFLLNSICFCSNWPD